MDKQKKGRKRFKTKQLNRKLTAIFALLIVLAMVVGLFSNSADMVYAADRNADSSTTDTYSTVLGSVASTAQDGRVWTDKSVSSETITLDGTTIECADNNFLITYSALANSTSISGSSQAPIDVVFVIDISGSMTDTLNGKKKISLLVDALNESIETLMALNSENRIAVVAYSDSATTLLPLDHYTKQSSGWSSRDYFSLDGSTLETRAINSQGRDVSEEISVKGGTNIHVGVDAGMDILKEEDSTTVSINGTTVQRVPALILLSDGMPTYSGGDNSNWWDPSGKSGTGYSASQSSAQSREAYEKFALKTIMNASYNKEQVNTHYGVSGENAMKVYTIGVGMNSLQQGTERNTARLTLDPTSYLNQDNTISNAVRTQWNNYL